MVDIIPNYSLPHIHCLMLRDNARLNAYDKALSLVQGRVVLDYGAGTGILSMMAARAGADKVYAIEPTNTDLARQIIKDNGLEERVKIVEGDILDVDLPKVDAIVSEWMGVWALQENMLPGLLYARNKFLKKEGIILPACINMYLVPSYEPIENLPDFSRIQDFDLSHYLTNVHSQPFVMQANTQYFLSEPKRVHSLNIASLPLENCTNLDLQASYLAQKEGKVTCLYGWFDADFYGISRLDTSPNTTTHWQQARFLPEKAISVKPGENIRVKINSKVSPDDKKQINFNIEVSK